MSGIFRTNDPSEFARIDSIIIDEKAPAGNITGVPTNVAIMVGQFERGPTSLSLPIGSTGALQQIYGNNIAYSGNKALTSKRFGNLKLIRVVAADAVLATLTVDDGAMTPVDILKFDAKQGKGVYGNSITVKIEAGSDAIGKKYTIADTSANAVLPVEVFDQVVVSGKTQQEVSAAFAGSRLLSVTLLANSAEPDNLVATNLASGADGTIIDSDYETAIAVAEQERAGNVLFLDAYNATRNGYLKAHAAATQDKMVIVAGLETDDVAAAVTDAANYRDADGRIIYGWPWVQTTIDGVQQFQNPASWIASVFSLTAAHISLAYVDTVQAFAGATDLKFKVGRADFISLNDAGICGIQFDPDVGIKIRNAVTTHIINSQKRPILRRRMADFLTDSIALFLKGYDNDVNSAAKRDEVKAAILNFDDQQIALGILPGAQDVKGGGPRLVDTESLNTDDVVAEGKFFILYKRRIFSSMRFIVLRAEIGTGVVVTEQEG